VTELSRLNSDTLDGVLLNKIYSIFKDANVGIDNYKIKIIEDKFYNQRLGLNLRFFWKSFQVKSNGIMDISEIQQKNSPYDACIYLEECASRHISDYSIEHILQDVSSGGLVNYIQEGEVEYNKINNIVYYYQDCGRCSGAGYLNCSKCNNGMVSCYSCGGVGRSKCEYCDGAGKIQDVNEHNKNDIRWRLCKSCQGTGRLGCCGHCNGRGLVGCKKCNGSSRITCNQCEGKKRHTIVLGAKLFYNVSKKITYKINDPKFIIDVVNKLGDEINKCNINCKLVGLSTDNFNINIECSIDVPYVKACIYYGSEYYVDAYGFNCNLYAFDKFLDRHINNKISFIDDFNAKDNLIEKLKSDHMIWTMFKYYCYGRDFDGILFSKAISQGVLVKVQNKFQSIIDKFFRKYVNIKWLLLTALSVLIILISGVSWHWRVVLNFSSILSALLLKSIISGFFVFTSYTFINKLVRKQGKLYFGLDILVSPRQKLNITASFLLTFIIDFIVMLVFLENNSP
jgi:hypothetical protein